MFLQDTSHSQRIYDKKKDSFKILCKKSVGLCGIRKQSGSREILLGILRGFQGKSTKTMAYSIGFNENKMGDSTEFHEKKSGGFQN